MAWQYPSSTSTTDTVALDLVTKDSAFIDEDVLIFSQSNFAIQGTGDDHIVEVSGLVRSGYAGISLGDPNAVTEATGNAVFVDLGGKIDCSGNTGAGVAFLGNGNLLVNDGEISSGFAGVYIKSDVMDANRIVNHGTITGEYGIAGSEGLNETILRNSGRIEGTTASYGNQVPSQFNQCVDIIYNTGTMVGSVFLDANNDQFFGAKGVVIGTLSGGSGDDELYAGAGGNRIDGGEGNDTIAGGAGADTIVGGAGTDLVIYHSTQDSTFKHPDVVTDITTNNLDSLDFHLIDANTKKAGNQAFHFSADNSQEIGALWYKVESTKSGDRYMMLYGETDGDKQVDFCIKWLHHDVFGAGEIIF